MNGQRQDARQRPQTEGHDKNQRKHHLGNGARKLQQAPGGKYQPSALRHVLAGHEAQHQGSGRAQQGADIGHEQGLTHQGQPFFPAPEPLYRVTEDRLAAFQVRDAVGVTGEVANVVGEFAKRNLGHCAGQYNAHAKHQQTQAHLAALGRHGVGVGRAHAAWRVHLGLLLAQGVDELVEFDHG